MFVGHFGVGFAAKKLVPEVPLGVLFLATQWLDLLWPFFLLLGLEHVRIDPGNTAVTPLDFYHYPVTHSLAGVLAWSLGFAAVYFAIARNRRAATVLGAGVASHWFLDLIVHRPDLPLWPGGAKVGLGLWNSLAATAAVEFVILGAGLVLYLRATRSHGPRRQFALWSLVGFLVLVEIANFMGPPPPSESAIAWVGMAQWLLVAWAVWADRRRETGDQVLHRGRRFSRKA